MDFMVNLTQSEESKWGQRPKDELEGESQNDATIE